MTNRVINSKIYVGFSFKIVRLERIFDGHDRKIFVGGISDCVGSYGGDIGEKHCVIIYDKSSKKYCIKNVSETEIRLNSDIHLQKGEEACLEDGTVIYLGEKRHTFRLGEKNCG